MTCPKVDEWVALTSFNDEILGLWDVMGHYGILLVDDEPAYHAIVSALLVSRGGAVDGVSSTAEALDAVRGQPYDLILVDIHLTGDDGYDLVGDIRAAAEWARVTPILAFTTEHLAGGERHYIDAGFDGWLPKPFQAAELITTLGRWLGAGRIGSVGELPSDKLSALLGAEIAAGMIDRFHASLAEAVADIDAGGDSKGPGHKMGGLAGMLGFAALGAAWLSLEDGDASAWPTVRALTMEAIERHDAAAPPANADSIGT